MRKSLFFQKTLFPGGRELRTRNQRPKMQRGGQLSSRHPVKAVRQGVCIRLDGPSPIPSRKTPHYLCENPYQVYLNVFFTNENHPGKCELSKYGQAIFQKPGMFMCPQVSPSRPSVKAFALTPFVTGKKFRRSAYLPTTHVLPMTRWLLLRHKSARLLVKGQPIANGHHTMSMYPN